MIACSYYANVRLSFIGLGAKYKNWTEQNATYWIRSQSRGYSLKISACSMCVWYVLYVNNDRKSVIGNKRLFPIDLSINKFNIELIIPQAFLHRNFLTTSTSYFSVLSPFTSLIYFDHVQPFILSFSFFFFFRRLQVASISVQLIPDNIRQMKWNMDEVEFIRYNERWNLFKRIPTVPKQSLRI